MIVEGHHVGQLDGFRFLADKSTAASDPDISAKALDRAAGQALCQEIESRVADCVGANDDQFLLCLEPASKPAIHWKGAQLATVVKGATLLTPQIKIPVYDLLSSEHHNALNKRLTRWLSQKLESLLGPLYADLRILPKGPARGILFQLREHLGSMPRAAAAERRSAWSCAPMPIRPWRTSGQTSPPRCASKKMMTVLVISDASQVIDSCAGQ